MLEAADLFEIEVTVSIPFIGSNLFKYIKGAAATVAANTVSIPFIGSNLFKFKEAVGTICANTFQSPLSGQICLNRISTPTSRHHSLVSIPFIGSNLFKLQKQNKRIDVKDAGFNPLYRVKFV